jgi:vacuolar-type H+-ATPase subunit I/STV1
VDSVGHGRVEQREGHKEQPFSTLDIAVHFVHSGRVQPDGLRARKPTLPIAIAAVVAGLIAMAYSTFLGFGVNERCSTLAPSGTYCSRLNWMALLHAGIQVVLVIAAGIGGLSAWRATSGWRRIALMTAVAVVYVCLVVTAVVVYTDAAWNWANGSG